MKIELNIPYSKRHAERRVLDLFLPDAANGCAIFFIHGGGWNGGKKEGWHPVAKHFAARGFVCASVEYRFCAQAPHPAQIEDARLGMAYFRQNAAAHGFNPERIAVVGSSAGGHLAGLLATIAADSPLGKTDELRAPDTRPNAAILYCPATTFCGQAQAATLAKCIRLLMNGKTEAEAPDAYRGASPMERITGHEPPCLFLHGDADTVVPLFHSTEMARRLKAAGVYAEMRVLPNVKHGFGYGTESDAQKQAIEYAEAFLNAQFSIAPAGRESTGLAGAPAN